jgi:GH24 family phage-related lysozyme (muramidase)
MKNYIYIGVLLVIVYLILTKSKGKMSGMIKGNRIPVSQVKTNSKLVEHIKKWEGYHANPYPSLEGGADTIGYGHKMIGQQYTTLDKNQAVELLKNDIITRGENIVRKKLGNRSVTEREFNLLTDLAFGTGTIYNHVLASLDNGTLEKDYNKKAITINGEFSQGLLNRRNDALKTL